MKNTYFIRLADKKERERFAGLSLSGAHRDDFVIYLNGKNARLYCSQGQQRSIALALKLAEGELSRECTGEYPDLLLDDVFSELDKRRKEYIMSGFGDRQIILTTCEKNDFADVHDALKIETEDGKFRFTEGLERQFEYDLTEEEKEKMCDIVCEAGADYIKTSTGFSTAGANFHDVELMVKGVHGRCKVKAAGGISTVEDMETFLALGADRLGTSRAVKILNGEQAKGY